MAGEIFDKDPKTKTRTPVPEKTDCRILIDGSSAKWGSTITAENFLPAPQPGRFQTYVSSGDQTTMIAAGLRHEDIQKKYTFRVRDGHAEDELQFDLNRTTRVIKSDTLTVGENQKVTVINDQNVEVNNDQTVQVFGKLRKVEAINIAETAVNTIYVKAGTELILEGPGGNMIKIDSSGVTIQGVVVKIN
jgi:hypothetical protein